VVITNKNMFATQKTESTKTINDQNFLTTMLLTSTAFGVGSFNFLPATLIIFFQQWITSLLQYILAMCIFSVTLPSNDDMNRKMTEMLDDESNKSLISNSFIMSSSHKKKPNQLVPADGTHVLFVDGFFDGVQQGNAKFSWWNIFLCQYILVVNISATMGPEAMAGLKAKTITLYTLRYNSNRLERSLKSLAAVTESTVKIHHVIGTTIAGNSSTVHGRPASSLFISVNESGSNIGQKQEFFRGENVTEEIVRDATTFFESEKLYKAKNVPYKRGYMFHGPPGVGKSSIAHVLATELKRSLYIVTLNSNSSSSLFGTSHFNFAATLNNIPKGSIILFEDIDVAFAKRKNDSTTEEKPEMRPFFSQNQITMSEFLNAIDGTYAPDGSIFVYTTNHLEKLDPALLRSGRVDVCLEFTKCNSNAIEKMCYRFLGKEKTEEEIQEIIKVIPVDEMCPCELQNLLINELSGSVENFKKLITARNIGSI